MKWINFLHIYQPVNTDAHIIEEATNESYKRIVRALEENPDKKFTINISGCIFYRWEELGYHELIKRLANLIRRGQIDLTGTACYHPILPLIPVKEVGRQIKENQEVIARYLGKDIKTPGFFFPELAYSPEIVKKIKAAGFKWLLLDEIAVTGKAGEADFNMVYLDQNSGLDVVIRSRLLSNSYVPETITKMLDQAREPKREEDLAITATDAELYGLRHKDPTGIFEKLLKRKDFTTKTISEFINEYSSARKKINPPAHSWATTEEEYRKKEPFNLWQEKSNITQKLLWQLARLAYNTIENHPRDNNHMWARWHFVRGLASCTFWWASAKDFRLFGPISWSPDEIERGINEFIRAVRALDDESSREAKFKAEKLYIEIKKTIWEQHWTYYWKRNQ